MFEIGVRSHFSAAHHLRAYPGKCAVAHGHNWDVEVFLRGERLNETGMIEDYGRIKDGFRESLAALDHSDLNASPDFIHLNPTSENIAAYLYKVLGDKLNSDRFKVHRVCVRETPETLATYWE